MWALLSASLVFGEAQAAQSSSSTGTYYLPRLERKLINQLASLCLPFICINVVFNSDRPLALLLLFLSFLSTLSIVLADIHLVLAK